MGDPRRIPRVALPFFFLLLVTQYKLKTSLFFFFKAPFLFYLLANSYCHSCCKLSLFFFFWNYSILFSSLSFLLAGVADHDKSLSFKFNIYFLSSLYYPPLSLLSASTIFFDVKFLLLLLHGWSVCAGAKDSVPCALCSQSVHCVTVSTLCTVYLCTVCQFTA
jgi:hypothetical protein